MIGSQLHAFPSGLGTGAGSERKSFLSGVVNAQERQQAEKSGDRPGAEERGMQQTGEPTQEGSQKISGIEAKNYS